MTTPSLSTHRVPHVAQSLGRGTGSTIRQQGYMRLHPFDGFGGVGAPLCGLLQQLQLQQMQLWRWRYVNDIVARLKVRVALLSDFNRRLSP